MAQQLVRVRLANTETNVSAAYAKAHDLTVLDDESTVNADGSTRPATRKGGRAAKPKTTVAQAAAKKKAAVDSAPNDKENDR